MGDDRKKEGRASERSLAGGGRQRNHAGNPAMLTGKHKLKVVMSFDRAIGPL